MTALARRFRRLHKEERDAVRAVLAAREQWVATEDSEHFADYWERWDRLKSHRAAVQKVADRAIDADMKATDLV